MKYSEELKQAEIVADGIQLTMDDIQQGHLLALVSIARSLEVLASAVFVPLNDDVSTIHTNTEVR